MVEDWEPESLVQPGEFIEWLVEPSLYSGRVFFRRSKEEEF
jgi:hypothetical protein